MLKNLQQSKHDFTVAYEDLNKEIMNTLQQTIQEQMDNANQEFFEWVEVEKHSSTRQ